MTLNQIVNELEQIAINHRQVNTWGFGDVLEISTSGDIAYPLVWCDIAGDSINTSTKRESISFDLFFMDIVKNGKVNELEVLSDQLSIAKDFLAQLKHPNYTWTFENNSSTLEDFTERFVDSVAGWKMTVTLEFPFKSDRCVMPYTGQVSAPSGFVTIYLFDGSIYGYVQNNGNITLPITGISLATDGNEIISID